MSICDEMGAPKLVRSRTHSAVPQNVQQSQGRREISDRYTQLEIIQEEEKDAHRIRLSIQRNINKTERNPREIVQIGI